MASADQSAVCERAAIRAYLRGADEESTRQWDAAHRAALDADNPAEAARCAFWLGLGLSLRGQAAPANGWFARAEVLAMRAGAECPAAGYLLIPRCLAALGTGDAAAARDLAVAVTDIGQRCGDADLRAFGGLGHGQSLIALGESVAGIARLDDVMVSVSGGELSPITTGIVYCAVILECQTLYDLRRAAEWTNALAAWCDSRPDMVPFRGQCLVHRSQIQQSAGDWPAAMDSARRACRRLADPEHPALGLAYYQSGELCRLVGDFDAAEDAYRQAGRRGYHPMPGRALLDLARDDRTVAAASIRRALADRADQSGRPALLASAVEIFRQNGDFAEARAAADELRVIAAASNSTVLQAMSAQATGSVLLANGDVGPALGELRTAAQAWRSMRMPYHAATTAVLIGLGCATLGDDGGAEIEFDSARATFTDLEAAPDLARLNALSSGQPFAMREFSADAAHLSPREREVLTALAAGRTNRQIAEDLVLSPHTVARHVEHIYAKLGVVNRASAASYAFEHHLL